MNNPLSKKDIDTFRDALDYTFDMTRILFRKLYLGYQAGGIVLNGEECYQALLLFLSVHDNDGRTEEGAKLRESLKDIDKILPINIKK